jgi:hypothetical protein
MNELRYERRKKMKFIHKANAREHIGKALLLLAFFAAAVPGANAKHRAVKPAVQPALVIAHLPLGGASVNQMLLLEHGDIKYLYLGETSKDGLAIVDVTKPNQPTIIKRMAWPIEGSTGKLQMVGDRLALAETPDTATAETVSRTGTLTVLDLSDPTNPRTIQSFSGVTWTLADDARNLVYIANNDGLWILKHQPDLAASSMPRGCLSEDAFNEFAHCQ